MTANWPIPTAYRALRRIAACVTFGAISLSSSSHFPHKLYSNIIKPVAVGARLRQGLDEARPDRVGSDDEHDGNGVGDFQRYLCGAAAPGHKYIRSQRNEFRRILSQCSFIAFGIAHLDLHVTP